MGCRALVDRLLRALVAHFGERPLEAAEDLTQGDLLRPAGQPVSALIAPLTGYDADAPEFVQDRTEEPDGQVLFIRELFCR